MKFLQATILLATAVGYVTASHLEYVRYDDLRDAVDKGKLDIAVELCKQDETLGKEGVDYVIKKGDFDFITNFVNQTSQANAYTLDRLWRQSRIEAFEKVLERVHFPQQAMVDLISDCNVGYYAEKFFVLLNKITALEDQEKAVENTIALVAMSHTETSRLLNILKGKTFRSERLEHLAIQKAFIEGAKSKSLELLPAGICNHAAITPELYADALIVCAGWQKSSMRRFLLKQADRYDLEAVKEKAGYEGLDTDFRDAIEEALKTAALGGTRTRTHDVQTVEKAEEVFEELGSTVLLKDLASIVGDFVALDPPKRRKEQAASKKAAKEVASDVTSTPTRVEGSEDIGSERVGEKEQP